MKIQTHFIALMIYKGIFSGCAFSFTLSEQNIDDEDLC